MDTRTKWLETGRADVFFEDSSTGRLKKELWDASDEEIDKILEDYGIPAASELGQPGTYIQNTPRAAVIEKRRKNDIVLVPLGCTENHGLHSPSGLDTFMVSQIAEGVRRYTAKQDKEVALSFTPLNFGGHPYHHISMPGTVIIPDETVRDMLIHTMLGLWDDGFRKMIFINNHGQLWALEAAVQEFFKRYQLPAFVTIVEWHRAVREFFFPADGDNRFDTPFLHADEAETAVGNLLFGDMMDMSVVEDAEPQPLMLQGHYDNSIDSRRRPHMWSEAQGHNVLEKIGTPSGTCGYPSRGTAEKAKRPVAAILKYLTLMVDEILEAYPAGEVPPVEKVTFRTEEEMAPYLKEPLSEGWKSVHELPKIGAFYK